MGYKLGSGLGKDEQGITESIKVDTNLGKRGLGLKIDSLNLSDGSWDFSKEEIIIDEKIKWLENQTNPTLVDENIEKWLKEGFPNEDVTGNSSFCDKEVLQNVFKAKVLIDSLEVFVLLQLRF